MSTTVCRLSCAGGQKPVKSWGYGAAVGQSKKRTQYRGRLILLLVRGFTRNHCTPPACIHGAVERFYCKRPILCLASSKILTPHPPLIARRVCTPRLWCGGRTHSLGGEGVGGSIFWKTPETALYSTYVSTLCTGQTREKEEWQCQGVQMIISAFVSLASGGPKGGKV